MEKLKKWKLASRISSRTRSDEKRNWSKQGVLELMESVKRKASRMSNLQEPPRILFIGETGSGKSSFISSVLSALSDDVTFSSMIGEKQGREENTSKRYLEYRVFMGEEKEPLNFILCDARGIGKKNQLGVADHEIQRLMDGKLKHGDLIESERGSDQALIDNRDPKPPSGVVFVQKAQRLGEIDVDVEEKLNKAADIVRERGIPCSVILTHIDVVSPSLANNLHKTLDNRTLKECVQRAAHKIGVTTNRVFLVKNYTSESRKHVRQDVLILRALLGILVDVSYQHRSDGREMMKPQWHRIHKQPETDISKDSLARYHLAGTLSEPDQKTLGSMESYPDSGIVDVEETKPKSEWSQDETIPKSLWRSGDKFYEGVIPKDPSTQTFYRRSDSEAEFDGFDPEEAGSNESSEDADYHRQEPDLDNSSGIDEGVGQWTDSSEEDLRHSYSIDLKEAISVLAQAPYPKAYDEDAKLLGAKPLFQPTVRQMTNTTNTSTDSDGKLVPQLCKTFPNESYFLPLVHKTLRQLCGTETGGSLWMSYTIYTDLGLPQDSLPPKSTHLQLFFLSSGQPAFLLIFYDLNKIKEYMNTFEDSGTAQTEAFHALSELNLTKEPDVDIVSHEEEVERVKLYTLQLGKLLTTALLNFCCCDFLLLPLCLSVAEFDLPALQKGLQQQMTLARQFYRGPLELSASSYQELKAAATAVTGVSSVPRLMTAGDEQHPKKDQDKQLVLMDADWRAVVSLLVETLTENKVTDLTYPPEAALKTQVAVVEAAKRLSFVYSVLLFTPRSQLRDSCRKLKEEVVEDTGVDLKLTVLSPDDMIESDGVNYVIRLDCPSDYMRHKTECKVLRVSQATTTKSTKESSV